jgi:hypothetical protein
MELKVAQGCKEHHLSVVGHMTFACLSELTSRTMETGLCFLVFGNVETSLDVWLSSSYLGAKRCVPWFNRYVLV